MEYKYSKYNYFFLYKGSYIGMNFVTKVLFALEKNNYKLLEKNKHDISKLETENKHLVSALYKLGVLIDKETNEIDILRISNKKDCYSNYYRLTIIPTLDCNFNCWYCYETHCKEQMTSEMMKTIEKHVNIMIDEENIQKIELDWFGGEPLICFNNIIYPLSKRIIEICKSKNIQFSNIITSNGSLATNEMISKFHEIMLYNFQITIDGEKELHNKVKFDNKGNSYQRIVNTINMICESIENASVLLRINFTEENIRTIDKIIDDFPIKNRKKIKILFQQVWQLENKNKPINLEKYLLVFENSGFKLEFNKFNRRHYGCYADRYYQSVITPDGSVFKCTARDFLDKNERDGEILENGVIRWIDNKIALRLGRATFENKYCLRCKYLPLCWGPCSQKIIDLKNNKDNHFKQYCYKNGIKKGLLNLYKEYYNKTFQKKEE